MIIPFTLRHTALHLRGQLEHRGVTWTQALAVVCYLKSDEGINSLMALVVDAELWADSGPTTRRDAIDESMPA